jgi:hypothetical protein
VTEAEHQPRRIAIILGPGGSSSGLLEQLLPLLGPDRDIEMHGVFLEEAEVQYAAELPFVQELCRVTFSVREFNSEQFERSLALRMRTAQRALAVLARRAGVLHSFRNVRGSAIRLLQETAAAADITVFEPARRLSAAVARPLRSLKPRRNVVALVRDSETAPSVLRAAAHLAEQSPRNLSVLVAPVEAGDSAMLEEDVTRVLRARPAHLGIVSDVGADTLARAVRESAGTMLVMPATADLTSPESLRSLRERLDCPICLVRQWAQPAEAAG